MEIAIIVLGVLLAGSNAFYMWQIQTLTNKLMSKDFAEYKLVSTPPPKRETPVNIGALEDTVDINTLI